MQATHVEEVGDIRPQIGGQTLGELAREALQACGGDTEEARKMLVEKLESDTRLMFAVADEAIAEAVRSTVTREIRADRRGILRAIASRPIDMRAATESLVNEHRRMLLDFPLAGGVKLRHATREQVLAQADIYRKTESDARKKGAWLEMIAKLLKPRQIVGRIVNEARAVALFDEAGNE